MRHPRCTWIGLADHAQARESPQCRSRCGDSGLIGRERQPKKTGAFRRLLKGFPRGLPHWNRGGILVLMIWLPLSLAACAHHAIAASAEQTSAGQATEQALQQADLEPAISAAERFLRAMDQRDYGAAWDQSASHFKASVAKDRWVNLAGAAREPLGAISARRLGLSRATKDLPKGPAGDYIIIDFETDFAIEPITEMVVIYRENTNEWRCIGYFVRPR
ncbi:MAG: DUF4019 domain-containing protein [Betaproteobacteria bacterium]|nr:DUF4019 domain-containing protein [Betaproteobacteria bacterium]NCU99120.1 DUF4019 domain-containing protein [Betaproteobacteria bacterium]NCX82071.1 DUF4019 domain-containing protein [Betaproteobacteria bacterium]NDB13934.1 DUF4019 domain-containing protein [Betaproteobacteria bacterium]NDG54875.1 DUF4019 domain-containing protein [Betaproteobacteria bacterium]